MVSLDEMNSSEFKRYLNYAIRNYADEHVKAGNWIEQESMNKATKEFEQLLPEGEKTVNNKLFIIRDDEQEVGMIWHAQAIKQKGIYL